MICVILVAGHETNLDQEIRADQTGQYRHLEGKCVEKFFKNQKLSPFKYLCSSVSDICKNT